MKEQYDLPRSWIWTTIGEVTLVNPRDIKARDLPADLPVSFIPMASVDAATGTIANLETLPLAEARKGHTQFGENDVIFAKITPCMENGKTAIARNLRNGLGFGSTEFHVLRSNGAISPEYLLHYVRQKSFRHLAAQHMTSTVGQLRVSSDFMERASIPLPPLAEQHRIVAKIEEVFQELRTTRQALQRTPHLIRKFRQSILASAFSGKLTVRGLSRRTGKELIEEVQNYKSWFESKGTIVNSEVSKSSADRDAPSSWTRIQLGKICLPVEMIDPKTRPDEEFLYVDIAAIDNERNVIAAPKRILGKNAPSRARQRIKRGDILFSTVRTYLRNVAIVSKEFDGQICSTGFCVIRPMPFMNPEFVFYHVLTDDFILKVTPTQTGILYPATKDSTIFGQTIPVPPKEEQDEIASRLKHSFEIAAIVGESSGIALTNANHLEQAILHIAFRGQLAPQDPKDEPASVTLERLREKQQGSVKSGKTGRK